MTFDDSKRIISYEEDEKVDGLRHLFLRVFSDVLSDDVAPAHVQFQKYDDTFKEYIDLGNGQKLEENARLKVVIATTKGKKVSNLVIRSRSGNCLIDGSSNVTYRCYCSSKVALLSLNSIIQCTVLGYWYYSMLYHNTSLSCSVWHSNLKIKHGSFYNVY